MKCPHKKASKKEPAITTIAEALTLQFKLEFTLITYMSITMMGSVWYLESGASFHITGNSECFSDLEEKDLHMNIEFGDDGRYSATEICTITFRGGLGSRLRLKDVIVVRCLKKNLILVVVLEDRGVMSPPLTSNHFHKYSG